VPAKKTYLKQLGWKKPLEHLSVPFHREEKAKSSKRVALQSDGAFLASAEKKNVS